MLSYFKNLHRLTVGLIGGGVFSLVLSILMGWIGFPHLISSIILRYSRLEPGSLTYDIWATPSKSIDIYLKVYFFNVTNPEEFQNGSSPIVEEIGPFVYSEKREKVGIEKASGKTLRYRQKTYLYFRPDLSVGDDETLNITCLNIPFVAVASFAGDLTSSSFVLSQLDSALARHGENLTRTETVRTLLLDGFSVDSYIKILSDYRVEIALGRKVQIPKSFDRGVFAIYKDKNGSDDGLYEVETGHDSSKNFGQIYKWNNFTQLPWWTKDSSCNLIEGTDGSVFRPFLERNYILKSYSPELCRTLSLHYEEDIMYKDEIPGYRFTPVPETQMGPHNYEPNECFCMDKKTSDCDVNGLLRLATCMEGAPVALSSPHFYGADQDVVAAVNGMKPVKAVHKTEIDIEPITGVMLRAAKRLQFNIEVHPIDAFPRMKSVKKLAFPIMWAEESTELPEKVLDVLRQLYTTRNKLETARTSLVGSSLICIVLGIWWIIFNNKDNVHSDFIKVMPKSSLHNIVNNKKA